MTGYYLSRFNAETITIIYCLIYAIFTKNDYLKLEDRNRFQKNLHLPNMKKPVADLTFTLLFKASYTVKYIAGLDTNIKEGPTLAQSAPTPSFFVMCTRPSRIPLNGVSSFDFKRFVTIQIGFVTNTFTIPKMKLIYLIHMF